MFSYTPMLALLPIPNLSCVSSEEPMGAIADNFGILLRRGHNKIFAHNKSIIHCEQFCGLIRDACLYLGEGGERVVLPAPAFSIAKGSATTARILLKFSTCMQ